MRTIIASLFLAFFALSLTACGGAQKTPDAAGTAAAAQLPAEATCPVTGEKFKPTAETKTAVHNGKTYYFCCPGCEKRFAANPDKFVAADAAGEHAACDHAEPAAAGDAPAAAADMPAEAICPVSGKTFKPTAGTAKAEHDGKTYYFCCPGCEQKFKADPAKYVKQG